MDAKTAVPRLAADQNRALHGNVQQVKLRSGSISLKIPNSRCNAIYQCDPGDRRARAPMEGNGEAEAKEDLSTAKLTFVC